MPYEFKFPDVGEGIHEGEIVKWFVKEGDAIKADQPLGEVETDKAVVEMPSPKSGTVMTLHVKEGGIIRVGEVMVTILEEGETAQDAKRHSEKREEKKDVPYTGSVVGFLEEAKDVKPIPSSQSASGSSKKEYPLLATPAVRNLARQIKVDLSAVAGTGPGGRLTIEDVKKAAPAGGGLQTKTEEPSGIKVVRKYDFFGYIDRVPLRGIKKAVANKMTESIFTAAQLTNMYYADVTDLWILREKEKPVYDKEGLKLTFMPYIVKSVALSLKQHPYLNSSLEGEEIILKKYVNIGVAVDSEEGLVVPVLKGADGKDLKIISKEIEKLANDVKARKINMMDLRGGTFTLSNLGSVGVEFFTPIINYPESAILGVGRISEKALVRNGKIEVRKVLPLSLTYDHRIIDGAVASRFALEVIRRLEKCEFA